MVAMKLIQGTYEEMVAAVFEPLTENRTDQIKKLRDQIKKDQPRSNYYSQGHSVDQLKSLYIDSFFENRNEKYFQGDIESTSIYHLINPNIPLFHNTFFQDPEYVTEMYKYTGLSYINDQGILCGISIQILHDLPADESIPKSQRPFTYVISVTEGTSNLPAERKVTIITPSKLLNEKLKPELISNIELSKIKETLQKAIGSDTIFKLISPIIKNDTASKQEFNYFAAIHIPNNNFNMMAQRLLQCKNHQEKALLTESLSQLRNTPYQFIRFIYEMNPEVIPTPVMIELIDATSTLLGYKSHPNLRHPAPESLINSIIQFTKSSEFQLFVSESKKISTIQAERVGMLKRLDDNHRNQSKQTVDKNKEDLMNRGFFARNNWSLLGMVAAATLGAVTFALFLPAAVAFFVLAVGALSHIIRKERSLNQYVEKRDTAQQEYDEDFRASVEKCETQYKDSIKTTKVALANLLRSPPSPSSRSGSLSSISTEPAHLVEETEDELQSTRLKPN